MGLISYVKEEIQVIRERDPAIKSNWEVFLYPSFKVILSYRVAHRFTGKMQLFLARWFPAEGSQKDRDRDPSRRQDRERAVYRSWYRGHYRGDNYHR